MRRKAFTLVEIMIVVLIIGILLAIAMPQWMNARENSRSKTCVSNLRQINDAKEIWAMETRQVDGAPCTPADIYPAYIKGTTFPSCPTSGVYTVGAVGAVPTCTVVTGQWPHILN
jgi:prepilin-type N-terminal cleavage/methylation domain-containing protein